MLKLRLKNNSQFSRNDNKIFKQEQTVESQYDSQQSSHTRQKEADRTIPVEKFRDIQHVLDRNKVTDALSPIYHKSLGVFIGGLR